MTTEGHLDDRAVARFAAGKCPPAERAEIQAHLTGCARCTLLVTQASGMEEADTLDAPEHDERALPPRPLLKRPPGSTAQINVGDLLTPLGRGSLLGRYLILHRLGEGGMGVVYAAYDPELDRKVAIKLLRAKRTSSTDDDGGQARLLREAQAMARVSHPNVIAVYDVGTYEDRVFVAMEFMEGQTLWRWLKAQPRSWREVVSTFVKAGRGLQAAHAAGLVHRDFKPENVLIDTDHHVRVTDFGLARQVSDTPSPAPRSSTREEPAARGKLEGAITREGTVVGTPQYMSPEQHLGKLPDARSDQFSFCAALYYALYRKHAFDPTRLAAAAREVMADGPSGTRPIRTIPPGKTKAPRPVIQEPPREPRVPAYVRRVIARGLSLSPEERFPSMEALLAELSRPPTQVWRTWGAAALAVIALAVAAPLYGAWTRYRIAQASEARLQSVWTPEVQRAMEQAFIATGKPYAAASVAGVKAVLDGYARAWVAANIETGMATSRGEQTELVLSLRRACLDRRLKELKALTAVFADADSKTVERAIDAVHALPDIKRCSDVEALTAPVSPPSDPATRAALERLASSLADVKASTNGGKYQRGLELAQQATAEARKLGYRPIQAEALYWLGSLQAKANDAQGAEQSLTEAVWAAEAGRQDELKVQAATQLVYVIGYLEGRFDDGRHWERLATAGLERLGPGHEDLESELLASMGSVFLLAGRVEAAQGSYERALRLVERALGPEHPRRALLFTSLGLVYQRQGDYPRAREALETAISLIQKARGADHPLLGYALSNFSEVLSALGDHDNALVQAKKALAIFEASLGPNHPLTGNVHNRIATVLGDQGHYAEALAQYRNALEIQERALGPDSPDLSYSLDGIGQMYLALKRPQESLPYLERALALRKHDAESTAETRFTLARALWEAHLDRSRALSLAAQARDSFLASGNKKEADKVETWLAASRP